ncbi:MAG: PQQ-like beta-propeller repeat protein [Gemmataceae bacterium]|nr:PQQ-like beta-propeller repeat protein [Gemmataceae bacterium]MCI0739849.1 PQQ-like beta-propeller repeat protein [Gemmataceae bacterium]
MTYSNDSTSSPGSRRLFLVVSGGLLVALAGLIAYQVFWKDSASENPERLQELQNVRFKEAAAASDWPQWRGPNRDGVSGETGLLTTWPEDGPRKLWERPVGAGYSAVAVARGRVFTMFQAGPNETVACWDLDGNEIWRHQYPANYRNSYGDGPRATPTVDGELVYTVGATGMFSCFRAFADGPHNPPLWTKNLLTEFGAENLRWGVSFSPLVDGDTVYLNPGGPNGKSLVALDKKSGAIKWTSQDYQAGYSSPMAADIAGERQIVFFTAPGLVGVAAADGRLLWRFAWQTDFDSSIATPIIEQDYVFVSSGYGKGCAMVKIDKLNGAFEPSLVYKNKNMKTHFSSCVRYKDHLYGFDDASLTCLDFRTGKVAWSERGFDKGSLMIADGHLFILGEYGTAAVAEATPEEYREKGRFEFSSRKCWTMPVVANGRLFLRDEQKLACYDLRK